MTSHKSTAEIEKEAKFLSRKFRYLKVLSKYEHTKKLLGLFYLQRENISNNWVGATGKDICKRVGEPDDRFIRTKIFDNLGNEWVDIVSPDDPESLLSPDRRKNYYKLTSDAYNGINTLINRSSQIFDHFKTPLPLDDFQRFLFRIDSLYYAMGAIESLDDHEFRYEDNIDLWSLAFDLQLSPPELVDLMRPYVVFSHKRSSDQKDKYFLITPGKPRWKAFFLRCYDSTICSYLCLRCHRTTVEFTESGREMAEKLRNRPPFVTSETLIRNSLMTGKVIGAFLFFGLVCLWLLSPSWFKEGAIQLIFFLVFWFLLGWIAVLRSIGGIKFGGDEQE